MKIHTALFIVIYVLTIPTIFLAFDIKPKTVVKNNIFIIVLFGVLAIVSTYLNI